VEHGKLTATVLCYMVQKYASPHNDGKRWGVVVQLHLFLTLALDGGEWLASLAGHFTPRKNPRHQRQCDHFMQIWCPDWVW